MQSEAGLKTFLKRGIGEDLKKRSGEYIILSQSKRNDYIGLCFSHQDGKMFNAKPSKSFLCFESQTDRENTLEMEKSFIQGVFFNWYPPIKYGKPTGCPKKNVP